MNNLLNKLKSTDAGANLIVTAVALLMAVEHFVTDLSESHFQAGAVVAAVLAWVNNRYGVKQ